MRRSRRFPRDSTPGRLHSGSALPAAHAASRDSLKLHTRSNRRPGVGCRRLRFRDDRVAAGIRSGAGEAERRMPRTVTIAVEQVGASTGSATARSHTVLVDRPIDKGGSDRGPLGGEYLLISLGGCFLSTLLAAVRTREADVSNVRVSVAGTIGGVPERFESMNVRVSAKYGDGDLMRKLVAMSERGCLVTNTLKDAVMISVEWEKTPLNK